MYSTTQSNFVQDVQSLRGYFLSHATVAALSLKNDGNSFWGRLRYRGALNIASLPLGRIQAFIAYCKQLQVCVDALLNSQLNEADYVDTSRKFLSIVNNLSLPDFAASRELLEKQRYHQETQVSLDNQNTIWPGVGQVVEVFDSLRLQTFQNLQSEHILRTWLIIFKDIEKL